MTSEEKHPYNLCEKIPDDTRVLIVGTAPPPRFSKDTCGCLREGDFTFFYGAEENYMWWGLLNQIAKEIEQNEFLDEGMSNEQCCSAARAFLRRRKLWMRDVLQIYHRNEGAECSSDDSDIVRDKLTEFRPILELRDLRILALTSEKAAEWTFDALYEQKLISE
jgi:hypothetical protein